MAEVVLRGELRQERGKGAARRLRREDKLPGVVYGSKSPGGQPIAVPIPEMRRILATGALNRLVQLDLGEAGRRTVLTKDLQFDPVKGTMLHVDFHEVALDEAVETPVPIQLVGAEERERDGGVIDLLLREITVSCLPTQIPEAISVDVSGLALGDTLHVQDLTPPPGVEFVERPDTPVLTVTAPAKPVVEEAEAESEAEAKGAQEAETES